MLTTVIGIGVDFVIIFFTEIALPGLFAAIDLLLCVIDFLTPSGWNEQLKCVEEKCFRGPNIVADMLVFTHLPVVLHRFTAIMEATLNSRTGKRFFGTPGPGTFSAKSRTLDPDTGEPVERTETESAGMGNPMYEFDFADSFKELLPTMGAEQCGGCFNCKVCTTFTRAPPMRPPMKPPMQPPMQPPHRHPCFLAVARDPAHLAAHGQHRQPLLGAKRQRIPWQRHRPLPRQWQLVHASVRAHGRRAVTVPHVAEEWLHGRLCRDRRAHLRLVRGHHCQALARDGRQRGRVFSGARAGGAQLGVGAQRRGQNSAHRLWRRRRRKSRTLCLPRVPQPPARGQVARAHVRHASRILQPRERLD